MLLVGEPAGTHIGREGAHRLPRRIEEAGILLDKRLGRLAPAQEVVGDKNLAVAAGTGADADRGHGARGGDAAGQHGWDAFEHHGEHACLFERACLAAHNARGSLRGALDLVSAELQDCLGRQARVAQHRYLRRHNAPYRGQDSFSPTVQWVEQTVKLNFTNVFFVSIRNHGNFDDWFVFKGPTNVTGGINARYFLQPADTEITSAVTNSGWTSDLLAVGASREVRIQIVASNTNLFNQDLVFTTTSVTDPTKVDLVRVRLLRDDDNDGLPNTWEQQYFGNTTNTLASADSDGDGRSNYAEYLAGTDPASAASSFRITRFQAAFGPSIGLTWSSVTNRVYTVERATNAAGSFISLWGMPGNPVETTYFDVLPANLPRFFYRIRAEIP